MKKANKNFAIASLICGIIGGYIPTASIFAVVLGHVALVKIKKYPDKYAGKKIAVIGLVLGYLGLIIAIALGVIRGLLDSKLNELNV